MAKTVLIVCEMQNDFLWEKRKSKFSYEAEKLTAAVKDAAEADLRGYAVESYHF